MSEHTPGPWRYVIGRITDDAPAFGFGVYPEKDHPDIPPGFKQHSLASGNLYEHSAFTAFYKPGEIEANARLIAAAPDMLAAGKKARAALEAMMAIYGPDVAGLCLHAINNLDTAIAKATNHPSTRNPETNLSCNAQD